MLMLKPSEYPTRPLSRVHQYHFLRSPACEMHAHEMYAYEIHAHEMYAHEVHAHEIRTQTPL
jgi:hypothetical protein